MKKTILAVLLAAALLAGCQSSEEDGQGDAAAGFPKPTKPYESEQAVKNGDVVNVHGRYANLNKWDEFLDHVQGEKDGHAQVRITQYSIEGAPIFYELIYDGKRIHFTYDNAMDAYGHDLGRPSAVCTGIGRKAGADDAVYYVLTGCDSEAGRYFQFEVIPEK